jgi:ketosteroid isomerase-like protein
VSDLQEFLDSFIPRQEAADDALRVTHVYRRENGEWKIVHRHGDGLESERPPS